MCFTEILNHEMQIIDNKHKIEILHSDSGSEGLGLESQRGHKYKSLFSST